MDWVNTPNRLLILIPSKINWNFFNVARKESTFSLKSFIIKWIIDDTAAGKGIAERKQRKIPITHRVIKIMSISYIP